MANDYSVVLKQINVDQPYWLDAAHLLDINGGQHTYEDIASLIAKGLEIVIDSKHTTKDEPATAASESTMGKLYLVALSGQTESGTYTEFITVKTGTASPYTYNWEKIGTTAADLMEYAKKVDAGKAGTYTSTTPSSNVTSSTDLGTAVGSGTISYKKSDTSTGSTGSTATSNSSNVSAGTVDFTKATFTGSSATISGSTSYTPAGSISNTYTAAGTTTVNHITAAALSATPTFTGTESTVSVSANYTPAGSVSNHSHNVTAKGSISVGTGTANYTPAGTISKVTAAAHSHTVNVSTATQTIVTAGTTVTGNQGAHTHAVNSHEHSANVEAVGTLKTTDIYQITGVGALPTLTARPYGFTASKSNVMYSPKVENGVLSWSTDNAGTQVALNAGSLPTRASIAVVTGASTTVTASGAPSAKTLTAVSAGSHTHSIASATTATLTYVNGATTSTAGAIDVTPTFTGTGAQLVFTGSAVTSTGTAPTFTGTAATITSTGAYTPEGTVSKPSISLTSTGKTVATEGVKAVTSTFSGTASTISISTTYTPTGSITGTQSLGAHSHTYVTLPAHTHSIGMSDTNVEVNVSVPIGAHTHTLNNHTHNVTIPAISAS